MPTPCKFRVGDIVRLDPSKVNVWYERDAGRDLEVTKVNYYDGDWLVYYINHRGEQIGAYQWRFFDSPEVAGKSPLERKIHKLWNQQNYVKKEKANATV